MTNHDKLNIGKTIDAIASSSEFQQGRQDNLNLHRSFSRAALRLSGLGWDTDNRSNSYEDDLEGNSTIDTRNPNLRHFESATYAVAGTLGDYVHAIEGIRHHHEIEDQGRDTHIALKNRAIRFNHSLKSMIESDPSLTFDEVSSFVRDLNGVLHRDRWGDNAEGWDEESKWFKQQFEATLRGMQHEVVAHQVIDTINRTDPIIDPETGERSPRVRVNSHVTAEDERKGVDMHITLDGVTFPVDIKASEHTAANARKKSRLPESIITTGITSTRLNGSFVANEFDARKHSGAMLEKLKKARMAYLIQNPREYPHIPRKHPQAQHVADMAS